MNWKNKQESFFLETVKKGKNKTWILTSRVVYQDEKLLKSHTRVFFWSFQKVPEKIHLINRWIVNIYFSNYWEIKKSHIWHSLWIKWKKFNCVKKVTHVVHVHVFLIGSFFYNGHFGARNDPTIRISKFFDEMRLPRSLKPLRLLRLLRSLRLQRF